MNTEHTYKFSVVKFDIVANDYAMFLVKVLVTPFNISFHIKDRYSGLQQWQSSVKNNIENSAGLPNFPGKKWFGKLDREFLKRRSQEIEMFLNMFLKHPEVIKSKLVPVYFNERACEKLDKQAIEDLVMHLNDKRTNRPKPIEVPTKQQPNKGSGADKVQQLIQKPVDDSLIKFQEKFEAECKRIVTEIQDKFIDLNVGDNESGYGQDEMQMK